MAECFPEKSSWCRNEQVCQRLSVKRFERSNGLNTLLYKSISLLLLPSELMQMREREQHLRSPVPSREREDWGTFYTLTCSTEPNYNLELCHFRRNSRYLTGQHKLRQRHSRSQRGPCHCGCLLSQRSSGLTSKYETFAQSERAVPLWVSIVTKIIRTYF